jgi:RimJ/RimL family protein N-acetyltransferase
MEIFAETERLLLREILPADLPGMYALDSDPEVHRYLGGRPVKDPEESRKTIDFIRQQYRANGIGRWAVIEKETGQFTGWSGLKLITEPINGRSNYYDLGYRFIRRYWGRGFAGESAKAARDYGFNTLHLAEICGMAEAGNLSSQNVLLKVGLRYVDTFDYEGNQMHWYRMNNPAATP